jgi:hypothetical protein
MVLTDISEKTQYYHRLRKIRAPKTMDGNTGLPQSNIGSRSAALSVAAPQNPTSDPVQVNSEFGNFTALPEHRFYTSLAAQASVSPESSGAGSHAETHRMSMGSSSSGGEMILDIDWVS